MSCLAEDPVRQRYVRVDAISDAHLQPSEHDGDEPSGLARSYPPFFYELLTLQCLFRIYSQNNDKVENGLYNLPPHHQLVSDVLVQRIHLAGH